VFWQENTGAHEPSVDTAALLISTVTWARWVPPTTIVLSAPNVDTSTAAPAPLPVGAGRFTNWFMVYRLLAWVRAAGLACFTSPGVPCLARESTVRAATSFALASPTCR
jgi:hypothetical protein